MLFAFKTKKQKLDGGFKHFFNFHHYPREDPPFWRAYFFRWVETIRLIFVLWASWFILIRRTRAKTHHWNPVRISSHVKKTHDLDLAGDIPSIPYKTYGEFTARCRFLIFFVVKLCFSSFLKKLWGVIPWSVYIPYDSGSMLQLLWASSLFSVGFPFGRGMGRSKPSAEVNPKWWWKVRESYRKMAERFRFLNL